MLLSRIPYQEQVYDKYNLNQICTMHVYLEQERFAWPAPRGEGLRMPSIHARH